ncbi:MAG: threonine/serine exporter family protein [Clostridiales Family XIII bacterium]|jgi:uncharacterized membrane protein YjjP (DUF1212 family)|nr:threonine/serine exporter family protein [Clostridiales Family XIII bacterium]
MEKLTDLYQQKILALALFAGEIMMKSGAEIYRVEDTVARICHTCGIGYVECFATTTGIFLSLDNSSDEHNMHTFIKRINGTAINLSKISKINRFSRKFTETDSPVEEWHEQLREINAEKFLALPLRILGAILVGAFIVPYYGGDVFDMIAAAISAGAGCLISAGVEKLRVPPFMNIFFSSAGCALLILLLASIGLGHNITPMFIGAVTIFMPGVALTNAARDLLSGEMLGGVARLAEALIVAVAIAGGIGVMLKIWLFAGGKYYFAGIATYPLPLFLAFGALVTFGFCLLFNSPIKMMPLTSVIGGIGMYVLVGGVQIGYSAVAATFAGSCIVAILAEFSSRAGKDATTVFILPGIIPFVPGTAIYQTMENILNGEFTIAAANCATALILAGSIALALILIATLTRLIMALVRRISGLRKRKK